MYLFKEFKIVILIGGIILLLVLIKAFRQREFSEDVKNTIETTVNRSNLISHDQLERQEEMVNVINLTDGDFESKPAQFQVRTIPFENLTENNTPEKLKEAGSMTVIFSDDLSQSARAWTILNQMGAEKLYILAPSDAEVLKYKFQPEAVPGLE